MILSKCVSYKKSLPISYSLGVYPTLELLESKSSQVEQVLLSSKSSTNEGVDKILKICQEKNIHTEYSDKAITRLAGTSPVYAVGVFKKYQTSLEKESPHLVLVNPEDAGNLGTIMRAMLAFSYCNLAIISPAVDIFNPKVIRAAMGANFKINFEYFDTFDQYQQKFSRPNLLFMTNGEQELASIKAPLPCSLVFGSESSGPSTEYTHYGQTVYINQSNQVDSLNLATAVGIVLYELGSSI